MKTISKQAARDKTIGNIVASLRIEDLAPRPAVIAGLKACMAGKATTDTVLAGVIRHHVALRRI